MKKAKTTMTWLGIAALAFAQTHSTLPASFPVNPRQFRTYVWSPTGDCHIYGRFEAAGGAKNDVNAIVLTSDEMQNLQNGNRFQALYMSGYVTVGNIDLNVPAGSYNIVFQNRDASLRTITADIAADW